jgi:hypothetical protein
MFSRNIVSGGGWLTAVLLAGTAALGHAQATTAPPPPVSGETTVPAGTVVVRTWELTGDVRAKVGYKDNVLLSAVHREGSAFTGAEAEVFWWRLPTERFEALVFANATYTRFHESKEDPHEWQGFAEVDARWFATQALRLNVITQAYYMDQVFDLSVTDAERVTAKLQLTGAAATTELRWTLLPDTWVQLKPTAQRDTYRDGSDDNWQKSGQVALGRSFMQERLELSLSVQATRRRYDDRRQYNASGRALAGTDLVFTQREVSAKLAGTWGKTRAWQTLTTVGRTKNEDNGSGYFSYDYWHARQEIVWKQAQWKWRATARLGRYDYTLQTVGIGIDPSLRMKKVVATELRAEYQWSPRLLLFSSYNGERHRSNDELARYHVNTIQAGLDWAF